MQWFWSQVKSVTVSSLPIISHQVMGPVAMILVFWMLGFKPTFSLSSFTFIKKLFISSLISAIRVVSFAYLRLLIFLPAILIPACASVSLAFHLMFSAYKLNKQGDSIQPWRTPFPIWQIVSGGGHRPVHLKGAVGQVMQGPTAASCDWMVHPSHCVRTEG